MRVISTLFLLVIGISIQCKSSQSGGSGITDDVKEVPNLLILLNENVHPDDLEVVKSMSLKGFKRTSRSQNLWMIPSKKLDYDAFLSLKEKLEANEMVLEINEETKEKDVTSDKNTKSAKTSPIKKLIL